MKTFKMFQIAATITILSIFAGCSDQLTSPELASSESNGYESILSGTGSSAVNRLTTEIELKPYGSYSFNSSNTDFVMINSIRAEIITAKLPIILECHGLSVHGTNSDADLSLNCNSTGFNIKEIVIENTTDQPVRVSIILTGQIKKIRPLK